MIFILNDVEEIKTGLAHLTSIQLSLILGIPVLR
jgi:hypothetical protein